MYTASIEGCWKSETRQKSDKNENNFICLENLIGFEAWCSPKQLIPDHMKKIVVLKDAQRHINTLTCMRHGYNDDEFPWNMK